jgi:hypothetical protein
MGMFDYFQIEVSLLPTVPSELKVGEDDRFTFQTKDTSMQAMCLYIQERGQALKLKRTSGEWVPGEPADENADFFSSLSSLGSYVVKETWYEDQDINNVITFYTDLAHCDSDGTDRYVSGWIEYNAVYRNGIPVWITVSDYTKPTILSDDQLHEREELFQASKRDALERMIDRRMNAPTAQEHIIDLIDQLASNKLSLYDETDLAKALNDITAIIKEYRNKHDPHYKQQR